VAQPAGVSLTKLKAPFSNGFIAQRRAVYPKAVRILSLRENLTEPTKRVRDCAFAERQKW